MQTLYADCGVLALYNTYHVSYHVVEAGDNGADGKEVKAFRALRHFKDSIVLLAGNLQGNLVCGVRKSVDEQIVFQAYLADFTGRIVPEEPDQIGLLLLGEDGFLSEGVVCDQTLR